MRVKLNENIILWALAVLQPASASDIRNFISLIYPEISPMPKIIEIERIFSEWRAEGYLQRVHGKSRLYSCTSHTNSKLSVKLRRSRDKARLFLLKSLRKASIELSGDRGRDSDGVSPSMEGSMILQEGAVPIKTAATPRGPRTSGRFYWPRISKQLNSQVGPSFSSPDTFFDYYSFPSLKALHSSSSKPASEKDLSITDLAVAIGITPRLITSFLYATENHYREFTINKRGGGDRIISSPRTFLKVVQYWILDYLLYVLPVHKNCHSYQKSKSILTNSFHHVGKKYVANVDISDFFPSITKKRVFYLLKENSFGDELAKTISRLVTLKNSLPQGAPTSPIISNSYLFNFDDSISHISDSRNLIYTRYADDMTISGECKEDILDVIKVIEKSLKDFGLSLNHKKTRIASQGGQQKVTGLVVNKIAQPSKKYRKMVRAMFHRAEHYPLEFKGKSNVLQGYISYLQSFPGLRERDDIGKYKKITKNIETITQQKV